MTTDSVILNLDRLSHVTTVLARSEIPLEGESVDHQFARTPDLRALANAYFAIVAICHQTSPLGERRLQGNVLGIEKYGWDYLKEQFLNVALSDARWCTPEFWSRISPLALSDIYHDPSHGLTLNRVNERVFLLNDLGSKLLGSGFRFIAEAFERHNSQIEGTEGFLAYLHDFEAYSDPVSKKSLFFLSIAASECGWKIQDGDRLRSPVDYHEIRGHLRIGTIVILAAELRLKVENSLPLTVNEDVKLRRAIQEVNDLLAKNTRRSSSEIHYLLWNVFRNCCPRESERTHCTGCGPGCALPTRYKEMPTYKGACIFSAVCESSGRASKVSDPPYIGHFY